MIVKYKCNGITSIMNITGMHVCGDKFVLDCGGKCYCFITSKAKDLMARYEVACINDSKLLELGDLGANVNVHTVQ